jgi:lycopene beta-cyclase
VGGGLQNGLIARALRHAHPDVRLLVVERGTRLGGDHTWSFHAQDVPGAASSWFDPLVSFRWGGTQVRFPHRTRRLASGYGTILSDQFHSLLNEELSASQQVRYSTEVRDVAPNRVTFTTGEEIQARWVIDARGPSTPTVGSGFQKFVGWEVVLRQGLLPVEPVVMDALVPQRDGFRFLYVLPFTRTRGLIEDTSFSSHPTLDKPAMRRAIVDYLQDQGWVVERTLREESGVLGMPWKRSREQDDPVRPGLILAGYRGGWFHPATGYSLPIAVRVAQAIADAHGTGTTQATLQDLHAQHRLQARFARLLNRLLFAGFEPEDRWNVFERFYGFPVEMIERFYSLQMTAEDRRRLVCGRPPRRFSVAHFLRNSWPG